MWRGEEEGSNSPFAGSSGRQEGVEAAAVGLYQQRDGGRGRSEHPRAVSWAANYVEERQGTRGYCCRRALKSRRLSAHVALS